MYNNGAWSALGSILGAYLGTLNKQNTNTPATNSNSILLPQQKTIQQKTGQSLVPNTFVANTTQPNISVSTLGNNYSPYGIMQYIDSANKNFF